MPNDSTVTVRLLLEETTPQGFVDDLIVNIVIVKPEPGFSVLSDIIVPIGIVLALAILLFVILIRVRPNKKLNKFLDRYENMVDRIMRRPKS